MGLDSTTIATYDCMGQARNDNPRFTTPDVWRAEFNRFRTLLSTGSILDIGCGGGRDAQLFLEAGYDYHGCDASESMLEAARRLVPNGQFETGNLYHLSYVAEQFNGIWSASTHLHVPHADIGATLAEASRILKRGGFGAFMMKEGKGEETVEGLHGPRFFAYYSFEEFAEQLTNAQFSILWQEVDFNFMDQHRERRYLKYIVQKP